MKKVFISQPMLGKTNKEIKSERDTLVKQLERSGYEVIDSIVADSTPETSKQGAWYLGELIKLLSQADVVYFMPGWKFSRGCKIEHQVAVDYEIEIMKD